MNKDEIIRRLRVLSTEMIELGIEMDYYGGMSEMAKHGAELVAAGRVAESWADGIEAEAQGKESER